MLSLGDRESILYDEYEYQKGKRHFVIGSLQEAEKYFCFLRYNFFNSNMLFSCMNKNVFVLN